LVAANHLTSTDEGLAVKTPERALALLRTKGDKRLLTTEEVRDITGASVQQWQRVVRAKGFPERTHVGRVWCVSGVALAEFLTKLNAIHAGLTFSEAAEYCRISGYTLRNLVDAERFVEPIGFIHGRPRYSRLDVQRWQAERLGGLEPPPDSAMPKARKKK
jgi:hypothetical protein